ncbi:hypothetical protein [Chondromyces apiculatus]|nr:hypothetical protein [Chondromyces apiculatus]
MMSNSGYVIQSALVRAWVEKGAVASKAQDVIAVLEARGLDVPAAVRERVLASQELAELELWIRRAAVVVTAEQLFEGTRS